MKIVVIGGTGLIGSKTVAILRLGGYKVVYLNPTAAKALPDVCCAHSNTTR